MLYHQSGALKRSVDMVRWSVLSSSVGLFHRHMCHQNLLRDVSFYIGATSIQTGLYLDGQQKNYAAVVRV